MKSILAPLVLSVLLSGCAVYEPVGYASYPQGQPYPYAYTQESYQAVPVYVVPPGYTTAPVYTAPPVYVQPPVSFSFGFLFGGHGGHDGHGERGRHGGYHGGWHHH